MWSRHVVRIDHARSSVARRRPCYHALWVHPLTSPFMRSWRTALLDQQIMVRSKPSNANGIESQKSEHDSTCVITSATRSMRPRRVGRECASRKCRAEKWVAPPARALPPGIGLNPENCTVCSGENSTRSKWSNGAIFSPIPGGTSCLPLGRPQ